APAADGGTRAALAGDEAFAPYLAYARSLWTGGDVRTLRVEDGQLRIGLQHVTPPVMVEYDPEWGLQAITMEDAPRQFGLDDPANVRAYVDRDRKSTRLNSSHVKISYAVFCLKKK